MIFEKDHLDFSILSLTELHQENVCMHNRGRSFDALSFRYHADTDLITETNAQHVNDNCVCFIPKNITYDRIAKKDEIIAINCYINNYTANDIECFYPKNPDRTAKLFKRILAYWNKKDPGYIHNCTAVFYQILAECCIQNADEKPSESKIQASVDYIKENFTNPGLSLKEIASKSFMSEVYFRKIFKDEFGTSPQKYIIRLRLQKAANLIETGDYSLKEIAVMSGYNDYKYFSSEFKHLFGSSPSEYDSK